MTADQMEHLFKITRHFSTQLSRVATGMMEQAKRDELSEVTLAVCICFDMLTFVVSMGKDFELSDDALPALLDLASQRNALDLQFKSGEITDEYHQYQVKLLMGEAWMWGAT